MRLWWTLVALLAALSIPASRAVAALPPIHHVYVIVLENESEKTTFGPNSAAPYLAKTLRSEGSFLPNYYGTGHNSNDNYIAMISGQAPNLANQFDCLQFGDFPAPALGAYGQELGESCVYPANVATLPGQLDGAGLEWRDYNEDMGADPARETGVCAHPEISFPDGTQSQEAADAYATRHNPFVYFHSIIDDTTLCNTQVVNLGLLAQDLASHDTPNYVFITPNLCNDGHDSKCKNGGPGGLTAINGFLTKWVPQITGSWAFRNDGGLLIVTFDEASVSDARACCGEIPGPGSPLPGLTGPGGGQIGAVLLSPYIAPGTDSQTPYNHYTMLRSVEDLFRLPHIGYAQLPKETSFGSDIFACAPLIAPIAVGGRLPAGSEITQVRTHGRRLTLYSVGNSSMRLVIAPRGRRRYAIRRALAPCSGYTFALPRTGHGLATVTAYAGGGSQSATVRF